MTSLISTVKKEALYYFLAFCLISNAIMFIPNRMSFYMVGIALLIFYAIKYYKTSKIGYIFLIFYGMCFLSSTINLVFNYRLFLFACIIFFTTPITSSKRIMHFREKFIFSSLMIFPILTIASLYCYYAGINMMSREEGDVSWDFSAFFPHSMWLAAAIGIANTTLMWLILNTNKVIYKLFHIIILLASIFLSVVAASRTALIASSISMIYILFIESKNLRKLLLYIIISISLLSIAYPYYLKSSTRIQAKIEYAEGNTFKSRSEHFQGGFKHLKESPIVGSGFATAYYYDKKVIGRLESGSGWLSVLFQTGILGFTTLIIIMIQLRRSFSYIRKYKRLHLFSATFLFICLHSCFEGYILTSGYYLCILFWSLLGYLYAVPYYYKEEYEPKHYIKQ
jgi:hypothetical protein